MLIDRKTRPICHGRMGKGNNLCSRVIARVLAETLLRAVKSKANRDVTSRRDCHSTVLVHKTPDKFAKKVGNSNWNTAIQASCKYQFWHRLGVFKWRRSAMRIVVVMLVFIVHCNVYDTTCCCVLFQFFFFFFFFLHMLLSLAFMCGTHVFLWRNEEFLDIRAQKQK